MQAVNNLSMLLDESVTTAMRNEAVELLKQYSTGNASVAVKDRLFELFLQRDDMLTFSKDFNEMQSTFGPIDEKDPFNWSQFKINTGSDLEKIWNQVQEADREATREAGLRMREWKKPSKEVKADEKAAALEESMANEEDQVANQVSDDVKGPIVLRDSKGQKDVIAMDDGDKIPLVDKEGRAWSGCILDTDSTQKTMPGNRVQSKRILVCIGNLRGAGGFGMGKGKTAAEALSAAFRYVVRPLIIIILFVLFITMII